MVAKGSLCRPLHRGGMDKGRTGVTLHVLGALLSVGIVLVLILAVVALGLGLPYFRRWRHQRRGPRRGDAGEGRAAPFGQPPAHPPAPQPSRWARRRG